MLLDLIFQNISNYIFPKLKSDKTTSLSIVSRAIVA